MEIIQITSIGQAEQAFEEPRALIYKHSTRCPTAARVKRVFDTFAGMYDGPAKLYQVNVIQDRSLSEEIAKRTGIRHESPQMILMVDGKPAWHASHHAITLEALQQKLGNL